MSWPLGGNNKCGHDCDVEDVFRSIWHSSRGSILLQSLEEEDEMCSFVCKYYTDTLNNFCPSGIMQDL